MLYPLKKLLVCLDMTEFDEVLIEYTAMFAQTIGVERIYFIHVVKSLEIPDKVKEDFPEMNIPVDESIHNKIRPLVLKYIPDGTIDFQIGVKEGNVTENILKWSKIKQIDLIIMGRKPPGKGTGANPSRIANISHCSVLMVPQHPPKTVSRIFVPVDFSKYSARATSRALTLRQKPAAKIFLQNIYKVPTGYHYTGKSYEEFADIMKSNSEKDFEMFVKKFELPKDEFEFIPSLDDHDNPADVIFREAKNVNADLIIIGSRGRTTAASLLLGSLAVALLRYNLEIPSFIVKNKNENMGFFQALMQI